MYPGRRMNRNRIPNLSLSCTLTPHFHALFLHHGSQPLLESSLAPEFCLSLFPNTYCLSQRVWAGHRSVPSWCPQSDKGTNLSHTEWWPGSLPKFQESGFMGKQKHGIVLSDRNVVQGLQYLIISTILQKSQLTKENAPQHVRPNKEDVAQWVRTDDNYFQKFLFSSY